MLSDVLGDYVELVTDFFPKPTVGILSDLADAQCCISQSLECLLANNSIPVGKKLEASLKKFLHSSASSGNTQPG